MHKIKGFGTLSMQEIIGLEKEMHLNFPEDYKQFLMNKNGGAPEENYLSTVISSHGEEIVLGALLGINENENFDLESWYKEYSDELMDSSLIIGTEYGSGLFVLICEGNQEGVYFWDNGQELEGSSDEENVYKLATSFSAFISGLKLEK
ncbi:SMI1/KNR4 family protein [Listeria booriae]|uniref:SMI1/KNR4 family protein n=1 Tax=Listeria booriae TaxID=1552123 RepID=A0A7X0XWK4_9LIST|nr:SMI1/KNR4 family protein [Listeria booriae]MBC1792947.1 SMI1/KNR4 family protein [Listeria booriae]MBC1800712.1 SMI1/KNR4 family protein [Listeria booriae]MBC1803846.1 SMI1/KNR4 family protein [Listeria booriae]